MSFADFAAIVRTIAGGRYFAVAVEYSDAGTLGPPRWEWKAYIDGPGWRSGPSPQATIDALRAPDPDLDAVDAHKLQAEHPLHAEDAS